MNDGLEQRLERLDALEAIRGLIASYARECDTGFNGTAIAALFTQDGIWEANTGARLHGRKEIAEFFDAVSASCAFAMHFFTNMTADVRGDAATGRCFLFQTCTAMNAAGTPTGQFMVADYQNDFERTEEGWRFRHLRLNERFRVPVGQDWGLAPLGSATLA